MGNYNLCFPLMLLLFLDTTPPPISNLLLPPFHVFVGVGGISFYKFNFFRLDSKVRVFPPPKCLFVDGLLLFLIIHVFLGNFDWWIFVCCVQELFGHCTFNFTLHFLAHLHCVFFFSTYIYIYIYIINV
jgi:hypothetical protein